MAICFPREVVEMAVVKNRYQLLYRSHNKYKAFCDVSGGRHDDATLAIGHKSEDSKIIIDCIKVYKPPFNPTQVITNMVEALREYNIKEVTGDNYAAEFCAGTLKEQRIRYHKSDLNKSALYLELLPRLCSGEVELLDDARLFTQLVQLERKTRSGGKDMVDHSHGGHDDIANSVAGCGLLCACPA